MSNNFIDKETMNKAFDSLMDGLKNTMDPTEEKKMIAIKYVIERGVDIHDFDALTQLSKQLHSEMENKKEQIQENEERKKEYKEMEKVAFGILSLMMDCSDD